jgi:hypothetical protein
MFSRRRPVARTVGAMVVGGAVVHSVGKSRQMERDIQQLQMEQRLSKQVPQQPQQVQQTAPVQQVPQLQSQYQPQQYSQPQQQFQTPAPGEVPIQKYVDQPYVQGVLASKKLAVSVINIPSVSAEFLNVFFGGNSKVCQIYQNGTAYLEFGNEFEYTDALAKNGHQFFGNSIQVLPI